MKKINLICLCLLCFLTISCRQPSRKKSVDIFFQTEIENKAAMLINKGKNSSLKRLLKENPSIAERTHMANGYSLLHEAVKVNNPLAVKMLLENEFNPNQLTEGGYSPLYEACSSISFLINAKKFEETEIVEMLVEFGADSSIGIKKGENEKTPLMLLAEFPDAINVKDKMEVLIDKGKADINQQNSYGYNAVTASLLHGDSITNAHYLIAKKHANVNTVWTLNENEIEEYGYKKITPVELLRKLDVEPETDAQKKKQEIIQEFRNQGIMY